MATSKSIVETLRPEETLDYGRQIGRHLLPDTAVWIDGDLGTGKTVLAHGIALGLDIPEWRGSPTFNIVHEYLGRLPFFHIDAYRITPEELIDLDFERLIEAGGAIAIEWAIRVRAAFEVFRPQHILHVTLADAGEQSRRIEVFR